MIQYHCNDLLCVYMHVYIRYGFFFGQFDIYSQLRAEVNTAILEVGQTCHLRPTGSDIIVLRVWLAAEGGVFPRVWACTFQLIVNLRVWPYAWRSVQNEQFYFICITHLFWMCLRWRLHILEPDPLPSKRNIIKSIDDFRRMCSIFSQPGAGKTWFKPERWYFKHGKHHLN